MSSIRFAVAEYLARSMVALKALPPLDAVVDARCVRVQWMSCCAVVLQWTWCCAMDELLYVALCVLMSCCATALQWTWCCLLMTCCAAW